MMDLLKVTSDIYGWCTRLYPREFQREYGEELKGVFCYRMRDSVRNGGLAGLLTMYLREVRDLPANIVQEHLNVLRKKSSRHPLSGFIGDWRSAGGGAVGFGAGMSVLILLRTALDPTDKIIFNHYGFMLIYISTLFAFIGTIGWFMIGQALYPKSRPRQLLLIRWGAIFGGVGGLITAFIDSNLFRSLLINSTLQIPFYVIQMIWVLICGACFGMPIIWTDGSKEKIVFLILLSAVFFEIGFWAGDAANLFYLRLNIPAGWRVHYWALPMAATAAIFGMVAGGLLGKMSGRVNPRLSIPPDVEKDKSQPSGLTIE